MINSAQLLADLKQVLKSLESDLRSRAEDQTSPWGIRLREEYDRAKQRGRTARPWIDWRDGEVAQAAVAWIIAAVFIRFAEDNDLLVGAELDGRHVPQPWIAGVGDGLERAVDNETAFYAASPTMTSRDWLQQAFRVLAALPAGRLLVDPDHSPVWHAPISATASDGLLAFFRRTNPDGSLVHDFHDPELNTRFLGDLYQDLSDYAKKNYALLQTPDFVESFILDLTLTPAIAEFGLSGLKVIDPACGSGHFLLGAFERLVAKWAEAAPAEERGARVQKALDSIHGVDLNPFAIAIARFRLTVAALKASGIKSLVSAPAFRYHLAIGDSLLGGVEQNAGFDLGDGEYFEYNTEDLLDYHGILAAGQYHVVVANPPYIQPPDAVLRDRYRALYETCHGKYALSVPFMELLFRLAKRSNGGGAGYVGQITANSFMKREFGKKLIEQFLSGQYTGMVPDYVDMTHIIDTSGAYIPGHGTPTVILVGRPRKPQVDTVRAVLGVRGEPQQPALAAEGLVWRDIVEHLGQPGYDGPFVTVADMPRSTYASFPWSLSGGGASELKGRLENAAVARLSQVSESLGITSFTLEDDAFVRPQSAFKRLGVECVRPMVLGERLRDWTFTGKEVAFFAYDTSFRPDLASRSDREILAMWPYRTGLYANVLFGGITKRKAGMEWTEFGRLTASKLITPLSITFAFVATHNHFVLDRGGKVFKQSAPVIKLPAEATEDDYYDLLGVLNSSVACFWLKQVSHDKRKDGEFWETFYEFTGTKLEEFPLPQDRQRALSRRIDETVRKQAESTPAAVLSGDEAANLSAAKDQWDELGRIATFLQEELDWRMYVAYGLADASLAPDYAHELGIDPNERAFEIRMARRIAAGETTTTWFDRHKRSPITELPERWPGWYRTLVTQRLEAIESNPALRMLEQPEYKRRWAGPGWDELAHAAARDTILDRLEDPGLWRDASGRPVVRSIAQIADALRHDERVRELISVYLGTQDYDLAAVLERLIDPEAVPAFAPLRYKPSGVEKFRAWEHTWDLQRAEDRGERVDIPVPPKYSPGDFLKPSYWTARGKLDVPKERFIALPGSYYPDDTSPLFGWAGWDHAERGQAFARLANELSQSGATSEQILPIVGALIELEPWLWQWHHDIDARFGVSPAAGISNLTNTLLTRLGVGRDHILNWTPAMPTRGRKSTA